MANSRVGNYQLEFTIAGYTSPIRQHTHSIYVAPTSTPSVGASPATIDVQLLGGGTDTLQAVADEYGSFVRRLFSGGQSLTQFTLWRYATENSRDFISAGNLNLTTTGFGTTQNAQQLTMTYRTAGGSILKAVFLEPNVAGDSKDLAVPDASGNQLQRIGAFMLSSRSPAIGIDNTFPVSALFVSRGQNERVWRKIYRA